MSAPALVAAIPLLIGVLAGTAWDATRLYGVVLAAAWGAVSVALWRGYARVVVVATVAGFLAAGALLGARAAREGAQPALQAWKRQLSDQPLPIAGIVREDAARTQSGVALTVDLTRVDGVAADGGVRLSVAGALAGDAAAAWRAGRTISAVAALREPLDYRDPGVASDRERLARQGIYFTGSVKSAALVRVERRGSTLSEAAGALRASVRSATASAVGRWSPRSAGVVTAILIGDRTGLDAEDERRLQEAGTYHVIAISGGNIALLTALLVALGRLLRLPPRATAAASVAILAFYGYAAGLAPSVLRATIAGMIYLAARALDHRGPPLNALAVAAALSAAASPLTILDAGFVLSFGATAAIVIAASRIVSPGAPAARDTGRLRALGRAVLVAIMALGAATLCAEIALAPVGARLFGRVSLAGLLLNFIAIPLMSVIQVAGLAAVAVAPLSSPVASACGWIAHAGTIGLLGSAALVDVAPWLVIDLPPPALWLIALWYAGWAGVFLARHPRVRRAAVAAIVAAALIVLIGPRAARSTLVPPPPQGWTRMVVLDVGQGDATLIQPAGAAPLIVDAGGVPGSSFDLGRRVTLPAAWAFGVHSLSALVLTHGDPDHIGGAPAILRALHPAAVWDGIPVPRHEPLRRLRAAADRAGVPWIEKRAGDAVSIGAATIRVLNPPPPDWERQKVRNDDSIVLDIRIGDIAFVLPGDITAAVEPEVVSHFDPAPLVILKAPHHGSAGSSSPAFVAALHPAAVIFSAGRRNPFGHPAPAVVDRYRRAGARIFSTADDGAVVIDTDGHTVRAWTWTGRREVLRR